MFLDTRRFYFHLSRRCFDLNLSSEENFGLYGKESQPSGVSFSLNVSIRADEKNKKEEKKRKTKETRELKALIGSLDQKCINTDLPYFRNQVPTTENIALYCFTQLEKKFSLQADLRNKLHSIQLRDSENSWVECFSYSSQALPSKKVQKETQFKSKKINLSLTRRYKLNALHRHYDSALSEEKNKNLYGKCFSLHGHEYIVEVTLSKFLNTQTGLLLPYSEMDFKIKKNLLDPYDKSFLNEHLGNTSGEIIVYQFYKVLRKNFDSSFGLHLTLRETQKNAFECGDNLIS